jgi:Ca2+-binding RTX toxin-like protein
LQTTVASGTSTYLFDGESATNVSVIDTLANIENVTGSDLADYIVGSAAANVIIGGAGIDVITTGAGADTVLLNSAATANRDTITDFTAGTGGDVLRIDISDFALAGGDVYVGAIGALAVDSSSEIIVLTGAGYADDEAAEDAIAARVTTDGLDVVALYFNTTTNTTRVIYDADAGVNGAGTVVLVGTLSNITTQAGFDLLVAANFGSQA